MKLLEAFKSAREGNFISHTYFDEKQSMHEFKYELFYEDGANLTINGGIEFLEQQEWAKEGWYIKFPKEKVDIEKLKKLHEDSKTIMLKYGQSYEDCIL